jgi:predicted acylesterase/phospholipase RssA
MKRKSGQEAYKVAHNLGLSALALSGGGIRSACVGLGVIQALAEAKLMRRFDYLSTVSGGGYIGSWLSAWLYWNKTEKKGSAETVLTALRRDAITPTKNRSRFGISVHTVPV